ncbi:MAG: ATP-binding protein [Bdellovibrionota bacterium]
MNFAVYRKVLFWSIAFGIFGLFVLANYSSDVILKKSSKDISKSWKLKIGKISEQVNLPLNFNKKYKIDTKEFEWTLSKTMSGSFLNGSGLLVGRIGDSDQTFFNGCLIGSNGVDGSDWKKGWFWGKLRLYKIPDSCKYNAGENKIEIRGRSWSTIDKGVFAGPIAVGDFEKLDRLVSLDDWLRFKVFSVFGAILFSISIYYFFVFLLVPGRPYNGYFALFSFCTSWYEMFVSTVLYRFFDDSVLILRMHFLASILGAVSFLMFMKSKFFVINKKVIWTLSTLSVIFYCYSLFKESFFDVSMVYNSWFPVFLFTFFFAFYKVTIFYLKSRFVKEIFQYWAAIGVFIFGCLYDVLLTLIFGSDIYIIPYCFFYLLLTAALSLAKEYADAFLRVEEQVLERTADLQSAMVELKSLDRMKQRFFANISHDLKTPIAIALSAVEETKIKVSGVADALLEPARKSLDRLQNMVTEILDNVKAESGELKLHWENVPVASCFSDWVENYVTVSRREKIELQIEVEGYEGLKVPMDSSKMRRVIENLLSNAIKFTSKSYNQKNDIKREKIIRFSIFSDPAKLYVAIDDSGIGIPDQEKSKIFERYFQSSRTSLREHGGSGIGLSYVKEIVELHNGKITVQDSELGGTRMLIELPLSQDVELTGEIDEVLTGDRTKRKKKSLDVPYPEEKPTSINPLLPNLLIAEDNPDLAQVVYSVAKEQYNVFFAENGQTAVNHLDNLDVEFHCALLDIEMPLLTGDQVVEKIRQHQFWRYRPAHHHAHRMEKMKWWSNC